MFIYSKKLNTVIIDLNLRLSKKGNSYLLFPTNPHYEDDL